MGVHPAVNGTFEVRVPARVFDMLPPAARMGSTAAARETAALVVAKDEAAARMLTLPSSAAGARAAVDLRGRAVQPHRVTVARGGRRREALGGQLSLDAEDVSTDATVTVSDTGGHHDDSHHDPSGGGAPLHGDNGGARRADLDIPLCRGTRSRCRDA